MSSAEPEGSASTAASSTGRRFSPVWSSTTAGMVRVVSPVDTRLGAGGCVRAALRGAPHCAQKFEPSGLS
jgi:hypothetical protein